eukprot:m.377735 g.377735  ORF g.377735 m.377735 type:complete len:465 (-) comp20022_c1_seq14:25-1419(-)
MATSAAAAATEAVVVGVTGEQLCRVPADITVAETRERLDQQGRLTTESGLALAPKDRLIAGQTYKFTPVVVVTPAAAAAATAAASEPGPGPGSKRKTRADDEGGDTQDGDSGMHDMPVPDTSADEALAKMLQAQERQALVDHSTAGTLHRGTSGKRLRLDPTEAAVGAVGAGASAAATATAKKRARSVSPRPRKPGTFAGNPELSCHQLGPLDKDDLVIDVDYTARKSMAKSSRTPANARWLWKFVARVDVQPDGQFSIHGDKYQGGFDYNGTGAWSGARNPVEFYRLSLEDKDEEKANASRIQEALAHYKDKGQQYGFRGTTFNGRFYKGMPVGLSHAWQYDDCAFGLGATAQGVQWRETKVNTDRWLVDVEGRLTGGFPAGSYLLVADQIATRLAEKQNAYRVAMRGQLHRVGDTYNKARRDQLLGLLLDTKFGVAPSVKSQAQSLLQFAAQQRKPKDEDKH